MKKTLLISSAALITTGLVLAGCDQKKTDTPKKPQSSMASANANFADGSANTPNMDTANPCAAKGPCQPANPCAAKGPSDQPNPDATNGKGPCNPCNPCAVNNKGKDAPKNPCNPCMPS